MPMLLGTKGSDILQWRESADLVTSLKGELSRRWEQSPAGAAEFFLEEYIDSLEEELEFEGRLAAELEVLTGALDEALTPGEVLGLAARYREVVSLHFRRRRSVLALCGLSNTLHDTLVAKAVHFAEQHVQQLGQGSAPMYALLVAGDRGRGEQTLSGDNRYLLLHEEKESRFVLFQRQLATVFEEFGLIQTEHDLWHGTLRQWRQLMKTALPAAAAPAQEDFLAALPPFAAPRKSDPPQAAAPGNPLSLLDLVLVRGSNALGNEARATLHEKIEAERYGEPFLQLARRTVALPLALGRFGRWRLERGGEQRAKLNLRAYALNPLVWTLRILALHSGIQAQGCVERIHRLLDAGVLDVDLATRLLQGYQCIMQLKTLLEIRGETALFCNPEDFSHETEARFKAALDAVLSLQKLAYQRMMIGQG
jgi:signal-transduction protein with cAMP-binding, CBS, and nucleotidyltransferase domain